MAWLSGWTYRKAVTLSRASGLVTNYQMKLLVGESSGATGEDVDCNSHVQTDFDDLRFTAADGETLLDYWIESITGTTPNQLATVWIEFNSIGTGATTFYMYYGKADATAVSNGDNTFLAFDDFEDDTVGVIPSGWSESENPTYGTCLTISGGDSGKGCACVATTTTYAAIKGSLSPGTQSCVEAKVKFVGNGEFRLTGYRAGFRREGVATKFKYLTNDSPYWIDSLITEDANWHKLKIMIYDTNKIDYWLDGSSFTNKNIYGLGQTWSDYGCRFQETGEVNVDTIFVRNYRAVEPAWGGWGTEEVGVTDLSPGGIASAESFGTFVSQFNIPLSGIGSQEAHGTAKIQLILFPSGIISAEAIGNALLQLNLGASGIASAETFGSARLISNILYAAGIPSEEAFGTFKIEIRIQPTAIGSVEQFGTPHLVRQVRIHVTGIESQQKFGTPRIIGGLIILDAKDARYFMEDGEPKILTATCDKFGCYTFSIDRGEPKILTVTTDKSVDYTFNPELN